MSHRCVRPLAAVVLAGVVPCAPTALSGHVAAAQGVGREASIQERLNRLQSVIFAGSDRIDEVIRELKDILALDPHSAQGHFLLGIAYGRRGAADLVGEAKAELRQALALNPDLVQARYYLAEVYLKLGRAERAKQELETALGQVPGHPQFLALLGESERQLEHPRRALQLGRQALKADPSFTQARYYVGLALLDLQQRDEAIQELERVVESGLKVADVSLTLGTAYLDVSRVDDALDVLSRGADIDSSRPDIRIQLARAYRSKGRLDQAEEQLELVRSDESPVLASSFYQRVEADLLLEQGLVDLERHRLEPAAEAFKKALDVDPSHGRAHRHLAELYLRQGSYALAFEHASQAEQLGVPLSEDARQALQERRKALGRRE